MIRGAAVRVAAVALAVLLAMSAGAQPPSPGPPVGWREARTGACVLWAPPGAERALERLAPLAPGIVAEASRTLGIEPAAPFRMVLVPASGPRDSVLERIDAGVAAWAAGYMRPEFRIGAIRLGQAARYPYGTPEAVLAHETAHQLMHDAPGVTLPMWFEEGTATWAAREWQMEDVFQLSSRIVTRELPPLERLSDGFHGDAGEADQAYAASFAFVSWSAERYGGSLVRDVLRESRTHPFPRAWRLATGVALERSEREWRREALFRYRWLPLLASSGLVWLGVLAISIGVWTRRQARRRAQRAAWDAEEERADPVEAGAESLEPGGEPWLTEWQRVEPESPAPPDAPVR